MSTAYILGTEETIVMNLGGSAVATHAEKKGMTVAEVYQVRSQKSQVTILKKEFPPIAGFETDQEVHLSSNMKLSNGQTTNLKVNIDNLWGDGDISIKVGNSYDKNDAIPPKDRLKIALKAKSMVKEAVKNLPDGTTLTNSPYSADGFGEERRRLYMAAGFSRGSADTPMMGIVKNGKILPVTAHQMDILTKAGYFKR